MEVLKIQKDEIIVKFTKDELSFVNNAINEALNGFGSKLPINRASWSMEEAQRFLDAIHENPDSIPLNLSVKELTFIADSVSETLNAIEDWEFQTRTGWNRNNAEQFLENIHAHLKDIPK